MTSGDKFRIQIFGEMYGQAVINSFDYYQSTGTESSLTILTAWQAIFRAEFIALLSDAYKVNQYEIKRLESIYPIFTPNNVPQAFPSIASQGPPPAPRWDSASAIAGSASDVGDVAGTCLPSFCAVNFRKVCDGFERSDLVTPLPGEKKPRGSFRISGIPEAYTEDAAGNELTDAILASFVDAGEAIREFDAGGAHCHMLVTSFVKDKFYRSEPELVDAVTFYRNYYAVADVTSLVPSPYISSQVSRKQTVGGLQ